MSAKTKIIVIRKSQLAFAIVILIIALLLTGLLISVIAEQNSKSSNEPASTETTASVSGTSDNESTVNNGSRTDSTLAASAPIYTPGVYTSTVVLNDTSIDVQVTVDENHINSISIVNLDEDVETSYPLVNPAIEDLSNQIISSQSTDDVVFSESNQYTSMVLYNAICDALDKAVTD